MSGITEDEFYERVNAAPFEAQNFFRKVGSMLLGRDDAFVHYTRTSKADMRIALPAHLSRTGRARNFATLNWQPGNRAIRSLVYLTPQKLEYMGFSGAKVPTKATESLLAELHLFEDSWQTKVADFQSYLQAAHKDILAQQ